MLDPRALGGLPSTSEGSPRTAAGTDAPGFDDLLRFVGEEELADRMIASISGAEQSVAAIDEPLETAITSQPAAVAAAHEAVRLVTEDLKGPFLTALRLRVPAEASGDTD